MPPYRIIPSNEEPNTFRQRISRLVRESLSWERLTFVTPKSGFYVKLF
jgi:hypothetical protein